MSLVPKDWSKEIEKLQKKSQRQLKSKDTAPAALAQLSRPVNKTSFYYYQLYKRIWYWCFVSLPFDLILLLGLPVVLPQIIDQLLLEKSNYFLTFLSSISLLWFIKDWIISKASGVEDLRGGIFKMLNQKPWLMFVAFAAFIIFEIVSKASQLGIAGMLIMAFLLFASSAKSVHNGVKESLMKHQNYKNDLTLQVEAFNKLVFNMHIIPLICARLTIIMSCIIIPLSQHFQPHFFLYVCFACIMVSLMQAEEKFFMIHC